MDCFTLDALAIPAGVCYTDTVNMEKCPIFARGHKIILFYHNWDRLSRSIPLFIYYTKDVLTMLTRKIVSDIVYTACVT